MFDFNDVFPKTASALVVLHGTTEMLRTFSAIKEKKITDCTEVFSFKYVKKPFLYA